MRRPKYLPLSATFAFLVHRATCKMIEPSKTLVEQPSTSDLQQLLDPAEEFVKDVLGDFCSQLSDGTISLV